MKFRNYLENITLIFFSLFGAPFFYARIKSAKKEPSKFLVIQTAKIGDLVCSTPVFRTIKEKYPDSFLSVLVIPRVEGIIKNNPYIDEIIILDRSKYFGFKGTFKLIKEIRNQDFDWSFSLVPGILNGLFPFFSGIPQRAITTSKYATRGAKIVSLFCNHRLEYKRHTLALKHYLNLLKFAGIENGNEKKEIFTTEEQNNKALEFLKENNLEADDYLIGISVTAGNNFKEWSLENFSRLADKLIEEWNAKIIFMGSASDYEKILRVQQGMNKKSFNASQCFSLSEVPALFSKLKLFISVDTGSLYMANAVDVPVVDIAGPIDIYEQPPMGDRCEIVQKNFDCVPCSFVIPPARFCKHGNPKCIREINIEDVFTAAKKLKKYIQYE